MQSAAPLRIDSSFFRDRTPATLQPSDGAIAFLTECLWGTMNAAPRGHLVVSDLEAFFRQHGLRDFAGVIPQRKCDLPHSTQFLQRWILEASRLWQLRRHPSARCRQRHLSFDGMGGEHGRSAQDGFASFGRHGFEAYGGLAGYLRTSRKAIDISIERLVAQAAACGFTLDPRELYANHIIGERNGSTKRIHFDANSEVTALQVHAQGVEGGELKLYDVGAYCNETGTRPWELVAPYAPPLGQRGNITEADLGGPAYIVLAMKDEFLAHAARRCITVTPPGNDHAVIFNNGIHVDPRTGEVFAIAHGARSVRPSDSAADPSRNLILSFVYQSGVPLGRDPA